MDIYVYIVIIAHGIESFLITVILAAVSAPLFCYHLLVTSNSDKNVSWQSNQLYDIEVLSS